LETSNFAQGQGNQRIARRRTYCTPHKKSGRLTPKLRERAVSGQKLSEMKRKIHIRFVITLALSAVPLLWPIDVSAAPAAGFVQARQDTGRIIDLTQQRQLNRLYSTGYQYYQIQEYANAIPALKQYTQLDSTNIDVWYLLATCYVQTKMWIHARDAYQAILRQVPDETNALQNLAYIYNEQGEADLHLQTYERIVELNPTNSEYLEYMLALYRQRGDEEGMLQLLQGMVERFPADEGVHRQIADIYGRRGDVEAQVVALEAAIENNPGNTLNLDLLGKLYSENLSRPCDAARVYELLTGILPEEPIAWRRLGRSLRKCGRLDSAVVALQRSLELAPGEIRVYSELAQVLSDRSEYDEAESWVKKALDEQPHDAYAYVTWGDILQAKGFAASNEDGTVPYEAKIILETAIEKYRRALELGDLAVVLLQFAEKEAAKLEPYRRTQAEIFMQRARERRPPPPRQ